MLTNQGEGGAPVGGAEAWGSIAAAQSQRGAGNAPVFQEKRELVAYEEDIF